MNCVVNNRGSMVDCMMNRGSVMDTVSTESCERSSWPASHKGDKSNQSKDLEERKLDNEYKKRRLSKAILNLN